MTTFPAYKRPAFHKRAYDFACAYAERYSGESLRTIVRSKFASNQQAAVADTKVLSQNQLRAALTLIDRSDLSKSVHAVGLVADEVIRDLSQRIGVEAVIRRSSAVISPNDNYFNLGFDSAAVARDRKHANYLDDETMLRTHMSSSAPGIAREYAESGEIVEDALFAMPGRVFRRDVADRIHLAHPHQLDLWRFSNTQQFSVRTMENMVAQIMHSVALGRKWRLIPGSHPYTHHARQIDVWFNNAWLEIGECGLNNAKFFALNGLDASWSSMVIGIGLERAVMLRKNISDIRLVDSEDLEMLREMQTLNVTPSRLLHKNRFVNHLRVPVSASEDLETIGDAARIILGPHARYLESIRAKRVGHEHELEVTLSAFNRGLTGHEANELFQVLEAFLPHPELITA